MQNVFNDWDLRSNCLKNLFLEDLGWIQVFFEKLLISYSCISFMKYCALRSFYIKLLCFSKFWFFFMHHLCLGFTCIALFLYPSCSFAVISLIVFTHNMHTLCYIGYSTWSKNWLINFWVMYFLVYAIFTCEL